MRTPDMNTTFRGVVIFSVFFIGLVVRVERCLEVERWTPWTIYPHSAYQRLLVGLTLTRPDIDLFGAP
jgi:hypothetical protein